METEREGGKHFYKIYTSAVDRRERCKQIIQLFGGRKRGSRKERKEKRQVYDVNLKAEENKEGEKKIKKNNIAACYIYIYR